MAVDKLYFTQDDTLGGASGSKVYAHGISAMGVASAPNIRHLECLSDPSSTFRYWWTATDGTNLTLNWAGATVGTAVRVHAWKWHSEET